MIGHDDFDRTLASWFEAEALPPAPGDGLGRVLDATRRRPRPAWLAGLGSQWVEEAPTPRLGMRWSTALVLLLVTAALVGGAILVGARLLQPSPPSPGRLGQLAYSLDGDIYVSDWNGRNALRIADHDPGGGSACPGGYSGPVWSPDGHYLAYRCRVASAERSFIDISGPNGHALASFPGVGDAISWSPDSTRVATWIDRDATEIGVFGLNGIRQSLLTLPHGFGTYRDEDAHWSADGESLLISLRPVPGGDPRQTWELPLDGQTPTPVPANDPRSHWDATYSGEGAHVAYIDGDSSATLAPQSLVVAATDGSQARVLVSRHFLPSSPRACDYCPPHGLMSGPLMSPMGDRIAVSVLAGGIPNVADLTDLQLVDVATGAVTSLATGGGAYALAAMQFSPVGDWILFSRTDVNVERSLWSVQADGSGAQLLVAGTDEGGWQPWAAGS